MIDKILVKDEFKLALDFLAGRMSLPKYVDVK
jgi:hypothetical protein